MTSSIQFGIKLKLDGTGQFVGEVTVAEQAIKKFSDGTTKSLNQAAAATDRLSDNLGRIGHYASGALVLLQLGQGVTDVLRLADAYSTLEARLRVASEGFGNAAQAQNALFRIANAARVDVSSLAETYGQLARGAAEAGVSQQQLIGITETLAKAVALSGGSAESARAALTQLSQGLASGQLRGEELNSVLEQTPVVARAIADGLGMPIGALREYAAQGKLSAEQVLQALERSKNVIEQQFAQLPRPSAARSRSCATTCCRPSATSTRHPPPPRWSRTLSGWPRVSGLQALLFHDFCNHGASTCNRPLDANCISVFGLEDPQITPPLSERGVIRGLFRNCAHSGW